MNLLKLRSYPLPTLTQEVKKIWPNCKNWRLEEGLIQFSLETIHKTEEWFFVGKAPENIVRFVRDWVQKDGLYKDSETNLKETK